MKFVTSAAMIDPSFYVPFAQAAEAAGYDGVSIPDSIFYPREASSRYPYNTDGTREFLENKPFVEPLIAMAAMGAVTSTLQFHVEVLKLPIRHPIIFAKELTSLAVLIGGRVHLGVGTSPWREDYEAMGLTWEGRGVRFEECIQVIRGLGTGDYFGFEGTCYRFDPVKLNPVPSEPVPILVGGHGEINIRRAARIADGWVTAGTTTEQLQEMLAKLNAFRAEFGTDGKPFEIHAITEDSFTSDGVRRLEEMGVTHTGGGFGSFNPYGIEADSESLQDKIDNLNRFADQVIDS